MAEPLGIYRVELSFDHGSALWGTVYSSPDEARTQLDAAREQHPDATSARVVSLVGSESGKTAKWEEVA